VISAKTIFFLFTKKANIVTCKTFNNLSYPLVIYNLMCLILIFYECFSYIVGVHLGVIGHSLFSKLGTAATLSVTFHTLFGQSYAE